MGRQMNRWLDKVRRWRATRQLKAANLRDSDAISGYGHQTGLEALEPRVLLSSATLLPAFEPDSRAVWASSKETIGADEISGMVGDLTLRQQTIDFLENKGVTTVYLFVGNENSLNQTDPVFHPGEGPAKTAGYESLIEDLHERGINVFAMIGGRLVQDNGTAVPDLYDRMRFQFDGVLAWNDARDDDPATMDQLFDGVNFDLEPWASNPDWFDDDAKVGWREYLDFGAEIMNAKAQGGSTIPVGAFTFHGFGDNDDVFLVDWDNSFDGTDPAVEKQLSAHLIDTYDYLSVASFRDTAFRLTVNAQDELNQSNALSTPKPIVIGVETTSAVEDIMQTFFDDSDMKMETQLALVKTMLTGSDAFSGFAIQDLAGYMELATWVTGRHVFYNNSSFDGGNPVANIDDDGAIPLDPDSASDPLLGKTALLPGETATFQHYTSYNKGINGIMIDIMNLAKPMELNTADFEFRLGNDDDPGMWDAAPAPNNIAVRTGAGVHGADRITITWQDNVIQKQWLQVTVKISGNTGLVSNDVFYFGNAVGETGNNPNEAIVDVFDVAGVRDNPRSSANPAPIDNRYDFNRDTLVDVFDFAIARDHTTNSETALRLITAPLQSGPSGAPGSSVDNGGFEDGLTDWGITGDATTAGSAFGETPTEGISQAVITTSNTAGGNIGEGGIESFLGLTAARWTR